ncbi:hypothetical protein BDV38DRAFT_243450 [Aspergillus pseudotamarii]|uniref:Uncharacterized protein n=1 Tax=Aspergillus pseudotamarii TaxID=132259 RepID=A0A5N6SWN2_ASPPS|nr:uncharacterized protein BDV38DRAFT_243450 [Aspergillus pseudotamarii]KAE8139032.1 hypothetical protein BDV38DRAFT_243450 [Aspergillus pseudotamarii]
MSTVESPPLRSESRQESLEDVRQLLCHQKLWAFFNPYYQMVLAVYWTFFVMGASGAAYGVSDCS